ncbi:unnamed protein product [Alopecurus aequalis]
MAAVDPRCTSSRSKGKIESTSSSSCPNTCLSHSSDETISSTKLGECSSRSGCSIQSQPSPNAAYLGGNPTREDLTTANPPVLLCGCKEPALIMTSSTPHNPNRRFLKCRMMIQAVNCTCYRGFKGCFLWVWQDRLEEYVKRKTDWNRDQQINKIKLDSAKEIAVKDEEIQSLRSELNKSIQAEARTTLKFQNQIRKLNRRERIYMFTLTTFLTPGEAQILEKKNHPCHSRWRLNKELIKSASLVWQEPILHNGKAPATVFIMEEGAKLPSRWETKKLRTPRLSPDQLDEKLNICRKNETDDEDNPGDEVTGAISKKPVTSRSSAKKVADVVSKFCILKRKLVTQMGFPGILQISQINRTDRTFTLDILKMVNCKNHKIQWGNKCEVDITPQALHRVLGIPCGSQQVCGMEDDNAEEKLDFIRICIGTGRDDDEEADDAKMYDSLEAAEHNVTRDYPRGMTRVEEEQFKVSFIVFLVCRFLGPIAQPNTGSKIFWGALLDANIIDRYNWCGLVVDNIIEAARKVQYTLQSKGVVSCVGGCSLALQVLFLDYLKFGCGNKLGVPLPRISDYSCSSMSKLIQYYRASSTSEQTLVKYPDASQAINYCHSLDATGATNKTLQILPQETCPTINETPTTISGPLKQDGEVIHTVSSYNQAVTNTKLPLRQKLALRYYMARIVSHTNTYKNAIINEGVKLATKLDEAISLEFGAKQSNPDKGAAPPNITFQGSRSASVQATEGSSVPTGGPSNPDDPFSLGIEWAQYEKPWPDSPSIPRSIQPLKRPLIPSPVEVTNKQFGNTEYQATNKGYNSDPETSRSNKLTPFSQKKIKPSMLWSTPTNLYVGETKSSPSVVNRNWSESALLVRVFEDDEKAQMGGKRLSFEFTDTPVKKKLCVSGRMAKSPWGQRLAHPARNHMLVSSYAEWITATETQDLARYIEITGHELKRMQRGDGQLSYNMVDLGVRRIVQLDAAMFYRAGAQVWRTVLESDFAMLVLAECSHTNNISIRTQFIGTQVTHEIKNCRMIAVPALVRENWCSYFWDMKLKLVHVIDPLFSEDRSTAFMEIHKPNVYKLEKALTCCVNEFFESWCPDWENWNINYVKPMIPNAIPTLSGILTLIALRDFNGTNFANEQNKHVVTDFRQLLLHEVLSVEGNEATLPENFIKSKED